MVGSFPVAASRKEGRVDELELEVEGSFCLKADEGIAVSEDSVSMRVKEKVGSRSSSHVMSKSLV